MKYSNSHLAAIIAAMAIVSIAGEPLSIPWYTIDGGGATRSTGDDFVLSGTIGQPDAGVMEGGDFKLTGGFWFETPPGDCNANGIADLGDHEEFVDCMTTPADIGPSPGCECYDVDGNEKIDLADFAQNQVSFIGN
jgi:hypothetical protein